MSAPHNRHYVPYGWQQERDTIADLAVKRQIPDGEFAGHKGIYLANLEGWLGGRFPVLLTERDRYHAALERLRDEVPLTLVPIINEVLGDDR